MTATILQFPAQAPSLGSCVKCSNPATRTEERDGMRIALCDTCTLVQRTAWAGQAQTPRNYAPAPESLKLLKATLRKAFPATKFSTHLHRGTAYGYASVSWTDGPSVELVDRVVSPFEGSHFNGMEDIEEYTRALLPDGRESGLRGVSTSRTISPAFARRLLAQVVAYYKPDDAPEVIEKVSGWSGKPVWELSHDRLFQGDFWTSHMHRASGDATRYAFSR